MMKKKAKEITPEKTTNKYERKLIRRIQLFASSKDADTLVRIYYDEIYYFVVRQINDRDEAYDMTQDILSLCSALSDRTTKSSLPFGHGFIV